MLCLLMVNMNAAFAGGTGFYINTEYKFSMKIYPGYVQINKEKTPALSNSVKAVFYNSVTKEKIIIFLNRNTDKEVKASYWEIFNKLDSGTILLMDSEREGRVVTRRKIEMPTYDGFVTVSENLTHKFFLLQEVKLFPLSGKGSAIVSFCYNARNHPAVLDMINSIEYHYKINSGR